MSLRTRLILLVLGLAVTLVIGLGLYLGGSIRAWSRDALDAELGQQALAISRMVKLDHGELEVEDSHDFEERTLRWPHRIETLDGEVLHQSGKFKWPVLPPRTKDGVRSFQSEDGAHARVYTLRFEPEDGHGRQLVLRVAGSAESFRRIEHRFRTGLMVALGLSAVFSALGAAVLAQLFLRPLHRLSAEIAGVEATALDRRVTTVGLDPELGRLAGAFNGVLDRLERAFELQRAFVARASHSLRTPVASILSTAEVALRRDRSAEEYRMALEEIARSARESARLAENLLALGRVEQRQVRRAPEEIELAAAFEEQLRLFRAQAEEAGISLESAGEVHAKVHLDRVALREMLHALVDNAIRYTRPGGRVTLAARVEGKVTWIDVLDTGVGIRPEERGRIFDRFYRGAAAEQLERSGSGLGLSLVRALADAEGIGLELGEASGGGTRVSLRM